MWIVLGLLTAPWRHKLLYDTAWTWMPAIFLFAVGLWLYSQSGKDFSRAQQARAKRDAEGAHGAAELQLNSTLMNNAKRS